ncbi:MAG TPA: hypothetical protein DEV93_10580 [Chloroflexi bacterium]|jgi:pyruvate dehydrogenase E2 component (dihydrolipoamide acetyltransferase)|nr:hypothetical protein [Chloroflexota bacterium]
MAVPIALPKLGMTMEEATVTNWLKKSGEFVRQGQAILEVETEKVNFEVEAPHDGILHPSAQEEQTLPVGAILGYILEAGEVAPPASTLASVASSIDGVASAIARAPSVRERGDVRASPAARALARAQHVNLSEVSGTGPEGRIKEANVQAYLDEAARAAPQRTPAASRAALEHPAVQRAGPAVSPLARRAATQAGMDPAGIEGSGHLGRVMLADAQRVPPRLSDSAPNAIDSREPMGRMRKAIAQRMHRSLQEMAQLTITMKADMTEVARLRQRLLAAWESEGIRPTYTDIVVRVVAAALRRHPHINSRIEGDDVITVSAVNVGLSVAFDGGLIVPVIHEADRLTLREIAAKTSMLAAAARARTLAPPQVTGGTFTVTTLGVYGVETFTPIVNPPEAAVLGVGTIQTEAAFDGDRVFPREVLRLSLSFDHRLIDGAPAAEFLRTVVGLLEQPYLLL